MIQDDPSNIQCIVDQTRRVFQQHKTKSVAFRKQQLKSLLQGLDALEQKFHDALGKDLGSSQFNSEMTSFIVTKSEVEDCIHNIDQWSSKRSVDTSVLVGPGFSYVVPEPYGVALVMSAWNYPLYLAIPPVAQAIAAGNCVVLKPSELSPHTSNVLVELFTKYLDKECYTVIEGGIKVSEAIIKQKFDLIIFTGSTQKGKLVAKAAAENLTPCILELGGKSPTVVDQDANIDNATTRIAQGRLLNCGQTCVACDYVMVHKSIKNRFIEQLKLKFIQMYGPDPTNNPDYIKIITKQHTQRLIEIIQEKHNGTIILGGKGSVDDQYVAPTIIVDPDINSRVMQEEIFGPILPIIEWDNVNQLITFINERPKPLALYYFGSSNQNKIEKETSSGAFVVNDAVFHLVNQSLPFGGVGNSGLGAYHGKWGFDNCSHIKPVFKKATLNCWPYSCRYPPYTIGKQRVLKTLMKYTNFSQTKIFKSIFMIGIFLVSYQLQKKGLFKKYTIEFLEKLNKKL